MSDKDNKDKFYERLIEEIYRNNYQKYGVPRITIELNKRLYDLGLPKVNHKKVERLMNKLGLKARPKQRKYVSYSVLRKKRSLLRKIRSCTHIHTAGVAALHLFTAVLAPGL